MTSYMKRAAKSVLTKLSKQKSNKSRRANAKARSFAICRRNKNSNKLPREVGAIPRRTNVDKDPTHGGNFGNNRDSTSGKVIIIQRNLSSLLWACMHQKIYRFFLIHSDCHTHTHTHTHTGDWRLVLASIGQTVILQLCPLCPCHLSHHHLLHRKT